MGVRPLTFETVRVLKRQGAAPRELRVGAGQAPRIANPGTTDSITFEVEIEPAAEPIRGFVRGHGVEIGFDGWVGLAAAIETIVDRPENGNEKGRS